MLKFLFLFFVVAVVLFAGSLFFDILEGLFKIAMVVGVIAFVLMLLFWIL